MLLFGLRNRSVSTTPVVAGWLETALTWVQKRLAPAMPWIFLAFRRALIPTVVALLGPILFLAVGQGKDIVYGLSEPRLSSWRGDPWPFHVPGVSAYFVTAFGYALSVWYSARLLCTVEPQGLPTSLTTAEYEDPARWYPRLLGVTTLSLIYAALLAACSHRAVSTAVVGAFAPTLLTHYLIQTKEWRQLRRGRLLLVCGVLALAALGYCLFGVNWKLRLVLLVAAGLPAAFWTLVVRRRDWFAYGQATATRPRQFGAVVVRLMAWLFTSAGVVLLAFGWSPAPFLRACGSPAIAFLFLASVSLFLATCHLVVRFCADGVPGLSAVVLLVFAVLVRMVGDEGLGNERLALKNATPGPGAPGSPSHPDSDADVTSPRRPRVYVSTYGGGIRAAAFTAQVLAEADDQSCGEFGKSLVALSGVSGGSVGVAVYLVARQEAVAHGMWSTCTPDHPDPGFGRPLTGIIKDTLAQDHLAPVIARMLARDAPHLPQTPARGQALLESLQGALLRAYDLRWGENPDYPGLGLPLGQLTGGRNPPINAYFNAADVDTGQITWFSNVGSGSVRVQGKPVSLDEPLSVGQPMLHSARFPLVSPAGAFVEHRGEGPFEHRLVDGGYIDNSGADTLRGVMRDEVGHDVGNQRCWIVLDGNQKDAPFINEDGKVEHPAVLTSLRALLQARTGNALRAINDLARAENLTPTVHELVVSEEDHPPALGWYLSAASAKTLEASSRSSAVSIVNAWESGKCAGGK